MRRHQFIAMLIGFIPVAVPAFFIGRAHLGDFETIGAVGALAGPATLISLLVFFRLEPNAGKRRHSSRPKTN